MKGEQERQRYLAARTALSKKLGKREIWNIADAWPLYAGSGSIGLWFVSAANTQLDDLGGGNAP